MSASDSFIYQNSMIKEDTSPDFTSKQWSYVNDSNQQNYGNKIIVVELTGFYNSQKFIDFSEAYIVIPLVTTLSPEDMYSVNSTIPGHTTGYGIKDGFGNALIVPGANATLEQRSRPYEPTQQYAVGFKSGYWNLIKGMSVNIDGKDIVQMTPNINYYCNFVAMTKWSNSDLLKHGALCGFEPDSSNSWGVNSTMCGDKNGHGCFNNTLPSDFVGSVMSATPASVSGPGKSYKKSGTETSLLKPNYGLFKRMQRINTYICKTAVTDYYSNVNKLQSLYNPKDVILNDDFTRQALGDGFYTVDEANDENCTKSGRVWVTTAVIRFKDICDLFSKLPLTRGIFMRLQIELNIGHMSIYNPQCAPINIGTPSILPNNIPTNQVGSLACFPSYASVYSGSNNKVINTTKLADTWPLSNAVDATTIGTASSAPCYRNPCGSDTFLAAGALSSIEVLDSNQILSGTYNSCTMQPCNLPSCPSDIATSQTPSMLAYGYGHIYDNTFTSTCPLMLAKCASSFWTSGYKNTNLSTGFNVSEIDVNPGLNCGTYSQYRTGLRLSIGVCKPEYSYHPLLTTLSNYAHALTSCRIYAPIIEMEPAKALSYLSNHKEQEIRYNDVLSFTFTGITSGNPINYLVASGIANPKRIVIIPFFHDDSSPSTTAVPTGTGPYLSGTVASQFWNLSCPKIVFQPISPFDSAPATTAPMGYISNFNIQMSNQNIFSQATSYDFEEFVQEVSEANAINGGLDTGLTSGLLDINSWRNNYRYYVANLGRRLNGDNQGKTITLVGKNNTKFTMDLYIFVEFERKLSLDVEIGKITI